MSFPHKATHYGNGCSVHHHVIVTSFFPWLLLPPGSVASGVFASTLFTSPWNGMPYEGRSSAGLIPQCIPALEECPVYVLITVRKESVTKRRLLEPWKMRECRTTSLALALQCISEGSQIVLHFYTLLLNSPCKTHTHKSANHRGQLLNAFSPEPLDRCH